MMPGYAAVREIVGSSDVEVIATDSSKDALRSRVGGRVTILPIWYRHGTAPPPERARASTWGDAATLYVMAPMR